MGLPKWWRSNVTDLAQDALDYGSHADGEPAPDIAATQWDDLKTRGYTEDTTAASMRPNVRPMPVARGPTAEQIAADKAASDAATDAADKAKWRGYTDKIDEAIATSGKMAGEYRTNQFGEAEDYYGKAMDNASRQQSILARRAAEQAARAGGSAGGGMAQAGSAQAALSGQGLMNQAGMDRAQMRSQTWKESAAMEKATIDMQYNEAVRLHENARTDEERDAAREFASEMLTKKQNWETFITMMSAEGGVENPELLMAELGLS